MDFSRAALSGWLFRMKICSASSASVLTFVKGMSAAMIERIFSFNESIEASSISMTACLPSSRH